MNFSNITPTIGQDAALDVILLFTDTGLFAPSKGGGCKFDPGKKYAQIEADGVRTPIVQLQRVVQYDSKITGKFISLTMSQLQALEPGAASSGTALTPIPCDQLLTPGDLVKGLRAICKRGDGKYVQVRFIDGALPTYTLSGGDKKEVETDITFMAQLDATRAGFLPTDCPYVIEELAAI